MKILLILLFVLWGVLYSVANSKATRIIYSHQLLDKEWRIFKMGFSRKYFKSKLEYLSKDKGDELKTYIRYLAYANWILVAFIVCFISMIIIYNI